jgi:hypothetical protein
MTIILDYNLAEIVYLKTDKEQNKRMITQISIRQNSVLYELGCNGGSSWHYDFEFSKDKDILETL